MIPALPGMQRDVRGNGEMFPLNGPCWSLFFEYIGNILYAIIIRRLSTRALAWLTALLCCALTWFAVTNQSGYGSIGVGWTLDTTNLLGGTLRMLCPLTIGMLMSRVFKPIKNVRGAFWACSLILIGIFHVPFVDGGSLMSLNGIFEAVCIIGVFPIIVWLGFGHHHRQYISTHLPLLGRHLISALHNTLSADVRLLYVAHQDRAIHIQRDMAHSHLNNGMQHMHSMA